MPARNIEPAVGAEEWPSGTQVWRGNMAVKTPKPTNISGKMKRCASAGTPVAAMSIMSKVRIPAGAVK